MGLLITLILAAAIYYAAQQLKPYLELQAARAHKVDVGHIGMNRDMARQVLNLGAGAGEEEIREAYRRLVGKLHPDQGGSPFLMELVIHARQLLEQEKRADG